jgi:hypothetical protein
MNAYYNYSYKLRMKYCSLLPVTNMTMVQILDVIDLSDKSDFDRISS